MSQENQIIGFTKWIVKWIGIAMLGLIVLAIAVWAVSSSYEYVTYEIPKRQIKTVVGVTPKHEYAEYVRRLDDQIGEIKVELPGLILENVHANMPEDEFVGKVVRNGIETDELEIKKAFAAAKAKARLVWELKAAQSEVDGKAKTKAEEIEGIGKLCDDPFPLYVGFLNNSKRTLEYVNFDVLAKQPGRSTNIASYRDYTSDWIIGSKEGRGNCWSVTLQSEYKDLDLRDLKYEVKINHVRFRK